MTFNKNGLLLIDKPLKWTSNDVIRKLKSLVLFKKIGHAGTLDPLATGLLPILINDATKYFDYFLKLRKKYVAEITFGLSTSTYDLEGEITNRTDQLPKSYNEISEKINLFLGEIKQRPPIYSALKKKGKKLYEYARKNQAIEPDFRNVFVEKIEIIDWESPKLNLLIECSSGFYVRSLAHDLGVSMGSMAVLSKLKRVEYGDYQLKNMFDFDENNKIENNIISVDSLFIKNPSLKLDPIDEEKYLNGGVFTDEKRLPMLLKEKEVKIYNNDDEFKGLMIFDQDKNFWKPKNIIR